MKPEIVIHPEWGCGTVVDRRGRGYEVLVEFENGRREWLKVYQLLWNKPAKPAESRTVDSKSASFRNRRMVEALRLGIVPIDCVAEFTYGREDEIQRFRSWLNDPRQAILFVLGDYGSGKTHLLRYFRHIGLEQGFAVANVDVDPNETPFGKPKRIYSAIVRSFAFKVGDGRLAGFRDFVRKGVVTGQWPDHPFFRKLRGGLDDSELWSWIEAREAAPRPPTRKDCPPLRDTSTSLNVYCNLLSALGWASEPLFGLKGLLILFDETEALGIGTYYQQRKGNEFFEALLRTAMGEGGGVELRNDPTRLKTLGDPWIAELPCLYKAPTRLKLVFAIPDLTEDVRIILLVAKRLGSEVVAFVNDKVESRPVRLLRVGDIRPEVKTIVVRDVFERYASAYGVQGKHLMDGALKYVDFEQDGWRRFLKMVIEALDLMRHGISPPGGGTAGLR